MTHEALRGQISVVLHKGDDQRYRTGPRSVPSSDVSTGCPALLRRVCVLVLH